MRVHIVRPDDLLVCEFEFEDIDIDGEGPDRRLVRAGRRANPRVIVHLPPQHVAEAAYRENDTPHGYVVPSRAAGPTRVVFEVPTRPSLLPIAYRLDAILDLLNACTLAVPGNAVRGPDISGFLGFLRGLCFYWDPPDTAAPGPAETAIELPLRLILSPDERAGFAHAPRPVADPTSSRVELWHTRLQPAPGTSIGPELGAGRRVRAVWMRQGDGEPWFPNRPRWPGVLLPNPDDEPPKPFPDDVMSQRDRHDIVHLSGNRRYAKQTRTNFIAQPVEVNRLALSSLGAWLHSTGHWDPPDEVTSLIEWTHQATQGRDHFVKIVRKGFLYPFGHPATKVKVTKREFSDLPGEPPILIKSEFIVVRQPRRSYEEAPEPQWYTMPLRSVHFHTVITPDLAVPGDESFFLIRPADSTEPFLFSLMGIDAEQNKFDLVTPLVWVDSTRAWDRPTILLAQDLYHRAQQPGLDAGGLPLALAQGPTGDTTFTTSRMVFTGSPASGPSRDGQPGFWPELVTAEVRAPSLAMVAGLDATVTVAYPDPYRDNGLGGTNAREVIARLVDPSSLTFDGQTGAAIFERGDSIGLSFSDNGERSGGLIQPNMQITGLSRQLGPVGGSLDNVATAIFDPADFFDNTAKLFGILPLGKVLHGFTSGAPAANMPRLVTEGDADTLRAVYEWTPRPQNYPATNPVFVVDETTTMRLRVTIDARGAGPPQSDVDAWIDNFQMNLLGGEKTFLELHFDRIRFRAPAGRKPDVDVVLNDVVFAGPLSFVEQLKSIIPLDGFADPPALEVTDAGITSSFSLSLPSLAVGVFSLQNLGLSASFAIPFIDRPLTVSFAFCTRQEPFLLTVSMFGGGGFFGITVDPDGVDVLEAALEFGASVAIDLGVAQGGVHVMAGIYFKIESAEGCTLTGYLRLGGNMSVLGLISASIELTLSFTYKAVGKATGRAELEVEIDIFLFSFSVTVECERTFAGSGSDPTFAELMAPYPDPVQPDTTVQPWNQYCQAYA